MSLQDENCPTQEEESYDKHPWSEVFTGIPTALIHKDSMCYTTSLHACQLDCLVNKWAAYKHGIITESQLKLNTFAANLITLH